MSTLATVTASCVHCSWRTDRDRGPELDEVRSIHELVHPGGTVLVGDDFETKTAQPEKEEPMSSGRARAWTKEEIVEAIQAHAREHGWPPSSHEWMRSTDDHPSADVVKRRFGTWGNAVVAAGFERPVRGRPRRTSGSSPSSEGAKQEERKPASKSSPPELAATSTESEASPEGNDGVSGGELVDLARGVELARARLVTAQQELDAAVDALRAAVDEVAA